MAVSFSAKDKKLIKTLIRHYPQKQAALGDVLYLAQERFGHLGPEVEEHVARLLDLPAAYVHQVVTFYTMYLKKPVGTYLLTVCDNVSCMLCGAEDIVGHLKNKLGIEVGGTTEDKKFTLWTVECLGACELAPVMMVNEELHGNLTVKKVDKILDSLE
ncbi:MAG: NADH-quinone oxidoreductase subunit NuoE [Gemmatimonadota bacterium]|nr:NADH-quinone oxidoreductase subunit NuoE [Gemmatimonadota bacterium]